MTSLSLTLLGHLALKGAGWLSLALLLGVLLRRGSAAWRYMLWLATITGAAVLSLAVLVLPAWPVLPQASALSESWLMTQLDEGFIISGSSSDSADSPSAKASAAPRQAPSLLASAAFTPAMSAPQAEALPRAASAAPSWTARLAWLPGLWLGIAAIMLLRVALCLLRLRRLERQCLPGDSQPRLLAALEACAAELSLSPQRSPRLLLGAQPCTPMVWGIVKPKLLLPAEAVGWSSDRLRAVLLHELAHLARRDPAALLLGQIVSALHWFNPLAWLALHRFRADQERSCDDAVLRHGIRASDYAQHLLDLSQQPRLASGIGLCALAINHAAPLQQRLLAILDPRASRRPITRSQLAWALFATLLMALPLAMLAQAAEAPLRGRLLDRHGRVLAESQEGKPRAYPLKTLAAHVLGYTRSEIDAKRNPAAPHTGAHGLEKTQDKALASGSDVTTSLDARVQAITTQAMQEGGVGRGAAVVLDPRTGEVLAMVSLPDYDPNVFIPRVSHENFDRLLKDQTLPLLNRAIRPYAPGSCFKLFTSLAAAAKGQTKLSYECTGSVTYGSSAMQCWIKRQSGGEHCKLTLPEALAHSCSCYFYQLGNDMGVAALDKPTQWLGFNQQSSLELDGVVTSSVPTESWMKANQPTEKAQNSAIIANTSIGQGFVLVTPTDLAVLAATLANHGKVPSPTLLSMKGRAPSWRADVLAEGASAEVIDAAREGMRLVVQSDNGTAKAARSERCVIAGKTGTAQSWRVVKGNQTTDNHAWFIGFAPFEAPTLAFAILVQGGKSGGSVAAPIARRIVEQTLALPADGSGEVKPGEVHQGHFHLVVSGSYPAEAEAKPVTTPEAKPEDPRESAAKQLRAATPQQYDFRNANLSDVLRFLARDAGIPFLSFSEEAPEAMRQTSFSIHDSPFGTLESVCLSNGLTLILDGGIWYVRSADDLELVGKSYALPKDSKVAPQVVAKDLQAILKPASSAKETPETSVLWKPEEQIFYILATRAQHAWVNSYLAALTKTKDPLLSEELASRLKELKAESDAEKAKTERLRQAPAKSYHFYQAKLGAVMQSLAKDSGITLDTAIDKLPQAERLISLEQSASPFSVLEALCRINGLSLLSPSPSGGPWSIRDAKRIDWQSTPKLPAPAPKVGSSLNIELPTAKDLPNAPRP